jgi:hypothetical protein
VTRGPGSSGERDLVSRLERRALVVAVAGALVAWIVPGGGTAMAGAVAAGALLSLVSFWAIRRGIDGMAARVLGAAPTVPRDPADVPESDAGLSKKPRGIGLFLGRYALLAGMAYVMIARLRLPPIGLLCGASVTMIAAAAELVRKRPS